MGTEAITNVTKHLALDEITLSDTNPRKFIDEDRLEELSESISKYGVIQPVTVRTVSAGDAPFEVVSGERRYRASRMAAQETIPAYVKEMDDDEAFEVQCIENIQREDVHPLDEAAGYQAMADKREMNPVEIAERMDKSVSYVTKRMKMNDLIEPLAELFYQGNGFKIGHAIELARLDSDIQQELYDGYFSDPERHSFMPTVRSLQDTISRKYMLELDDALFDITDPELYPDAGACENCPKRSSNSPSLFPELEGADRCTDKGCFQMKEHLHLIALLETTKDDPNFYFLEDWRGVDDERIIQKIEDENIQVLDDSDYTTVSDDDADLKGVFLGGWHKGEVTGIKLNMSKKDRKEQMSREEYLVQEIDRILERMDRKVELDREKVQKKIIGYLQKHFPNTKHKSDWLYQLTICWALYSDLGFGKQKEVQQQIGIRDEESDDFISQIDTIRYLAELDNNELQGLINKHMMPVWLLDNCTTGSYLDPEHYSGAFLMRTAGEQLIRDRVDEYDTEQAEEAKKRNDRYNERLANHRVELSEIRSEQDPDSDDDMPESAMELQKFAVSNDIPMVRQFEISEEVVGVQVLFKDLTEDQAQQVQQHLSLDGNQSEESEPSGEGWPPTVQLLVDHVKANEVNWEKQSNVTDEVVGVPLRYSKLSETQALQVHEYLVEKGEIEQ